MLNSHLFYAGFILADPSDNCDIYKIISKNHQANSQCLKITSKKSHFTTFCEQSELRFFIMKLEPYFPHFSRLIICLGFFFCAIFLTDFFFVIFKHYENSRMKRKSCSAWDIFSLYCILFGGWKTDGKIWRDEYDKKSVIIVIKSPLCALLFLLLPWFLTHIDYVTKNTRMSRVM